MKLAFVTQWFSVLQGGMERVMNLSKALAQEGHQVDLFTVTWTSGIQVPEDLGTGLSNLRVHRTPICEITGTRGQLPPEIVGRMGGPTAFPVEMVEEFWWNIMPGNDEGAERGSLYLAEIINDVGSEVIQLTDDMYWLEPGLRAKTGLPCSFLLQAYQLWMAEMMNMGGLIRAAGKEPPTMTEMLDTFRAACAQTDSLWAVSGYFAEHSARALDLPQDKFRVHYAGVWLDDFDPTPDPDVVAELELDGSDKNLLFLGRLDPPKGVHHLLSALPFVLEQEPEAKLYVAGAPFIHEQYPEICHYLVDTMSMSDQVKFLGYVTGVQRQTTYASCDLFVNPLVAPESAGIVMVEAMAAGKPVVAPDFGYHREILPPERGLLYPPRNTKAMAEAVVELLKDPERRQEMGHNGRQFVKENLTWEHQAEEAVRMFGEEIAQANG